MGIIRAEERMKQAANELLPFNQIPCPLYVVCSHPCTHRSIDDLKLLPEGLFERGNRFPHTVMRRVVVENHRTPHLEQTVAQNSVSQNILHLQNSQGFGNDNAFDIMTRARVDMLDSWGSTSPGPGMRSCTEPTLGAEMTALQLGQHGRPRAGRIRVGHNSFVDNSTGTRAGTRSFGSIDHTHIVRRVDVDGVKC